MKKIKYCCRNFRRHGSKAVYKTIKDEYPDLKQKKKDCLGNCKLCVKQCIVMIGKKEVIVAPTADMLVEELKKRIG
ncbi:YuzB family protein [Paenibacillus spongiae]|uniref:YuzB family protein n=1 Tax=Paenibacillus spongiae TaxID=2909671 RepID=A0ABY5S7X7_9BACL|nr:YuzB family protein [Paenibacillus spongiae]UVI30022.1 YuzB family protein [Paenibacillus spongiae]